MSNGTKQLLYLSLGANLGAREVTLERALQLLGERLGEERARSSFVETEPWGFASEHRFVNAAAAFLTALSPEEALAVTQDIERTLGRTAKSTAGAYADRVVDIDLLFFERQAGYESAHLRLPHPHMTRRRFVLEPLAEIAPEAVVPTTGRTVRAWLEELNRGQVVRQREATAEALEAVNALLPQLWAEARLLTMPQLVALLASPLTELYLLRTEEGRVGAMCTVCYAASPTGVKAWLEDVVVDAHCRGRGYGRQLVDMAQRAASRFGAKSLNFTSRPARLAANRLYQSMGYERRETNFYSKDCEAE